jgi:phosphatidylinositol kinase/protein kinase (PI-3  family)
VLRRNKDSLMAVLEAFVYDPLLNWRLIDNKPKECCYKMSALKKSGNKRKR